MSWFQNQMIRSKYGKATEEERERMRAEHPDAVAPLLKLEAKQAKLDAEHGAQKARKAARKASRAGR